MDKKTMMAACYVRVSTDNQLENYSIGQQTESVRAFCLSKGWGVYEIYTDGGYSGGNIQRPALEKMLKDMEQRKFNVVVVYKLDRLSRSQKDTLMLLEDKFTKNGIEFVSVTESFDTTTALGKAMIGIVSAFAQLEKDQIRDRTMAGRAARTQSGKYHGGKPEPTGYNYIDDKLIIDEYKAMQVKEVFDRFLSGQSINSIRIDMNSKYGGWPGHSSVKNALSNTVYIGKVKFNGIEYDGEHKPIIDSDTFAKVQTLLAKRKENQTTHQKSPFRASQILTSLVFCEKCGARYASARNRYKCYSRSKTYKKFVKDPNCKNRNWHFDELDNIIVEQIKSLRYNQKLIDDLVNDKHDEPSDNIGTIKKRLIGIDKERERLLSLFQIDGITLDSIKKRIDKLKIEEDSLNSLIKTPVIDKKTAKKNFTSLLDKVDIIFESGSLDEKRLFVSSLIESVILNDEQIQINWRI